MKVKRWCCAAREVVETEGEIAGIRQADLFHVAKCEKNDCKKRHSPDCLVGKTSEGRWP